MILNPITKELKDAYINNPTAALLIETTDDKLAAEYIVNNIGKQLLGNEKLIIRVTFTDKKSISIDDIREIQKNLKLKADRSSKISRVVAVENAEKLTSEAQNALLKILEELPASTVIILITDKKENLLATIQSRCFLIRVLPISVKKAADLSKKYDTKYDEIKKAHMISEGNYTRIINILENNEESTITYTEIVKDFLNSDIIKRQKTIDSIIKKDELQYFLKALEISSKTAMRMSNNIHSKNKWKEILKTVLKTQEYLNSNVNTKLALLSLSVDIPSAK